MGLSFNKEKCEKLLTGTFALYVIYCGASVVQEWIMKKPYTNIRTGELEKFQNSNAFVLVPSTIAWLLGIYFNRGASTSTPVPIKNFLICASLVLLTTLAMTRAIYITTYPLVMLFKSCNILSVIMVGIFCSRVKDKQQKLTAKKLIPGLAITLGIILYNFSGDKDHTEMAINLQGIGLLVFSLLCDGFLPDFQAEIKVNFKPTAMEMFTGMNKWKAFLSLIYCLVTFEFQYLLKFYMQHPMCLVHMVLLGTCGAFGQMVVFWMIKNFKQHIVPFVITTRKIVTVVISILFFSHPTQPLQVIGITIVFMTVLVDFVSQIRQPSESQLKAPPSDSISLSSQVEKDSQLNLSPSNDLGIEQMDQQPIEVSSSKMLQHTNESQK